MTSGCLGCVQVGLDNVYFFAAFKIDVNLI